MVKVNEDSKALVDAIGALNNEAMAWLALSLLPSAMMHGAHTQVWPDGLGGFTDREGIERVRELAKRYVNRNLADAPDRDPKVCPECGHGAHLPNVCFFCTCDGSKVAE
jgi:hypothetical protein